MNKLTMKKMKNKYFIGLTFLMLMNMPFASHAQQQGLGILKVAETNTVLTDSIALNIQVGFATLLQMKSLKLKIGTGKNDEELQLQAQLVHQDNKTFLEMGNGQSIELIRYTGIIPLKIKSTTSQRWEFVSAIVEYENGALSEEKIIYKNQ
jgi:hypothetical protein